MTASVKLYHSKKTNARAMAPNQRHPPGPPMTLANMYEQGVRHLRRFKLALVKLEDRKGGK